MFNFEKLEVWHKAISYSGCVYRVTRTFPADERFGLTNQIRRASTSIPSNIAEGSGRPAGDFIRFLAYASGSVAEVITQAAIARQEGFLSEVDYQRLYTEGEEISRMLSGLRRSVADE